MIVVVEDLGNVHGYYHDGIIHVNERIPRYLKEHVIEYLEACHKRSPELKVYYMRCIETNPETFRELYKNWDGENITDYMSKDDIKDVANRMREQYPEYEITDDLELIRKITGICSGKV